MIETDLIIKALILLVIISIIYTTIKAVLIGARDGLQNAKDIYRGTSYEQIKERNRKRQDEPFKKDLEKMNSKLYRFTHPLEYVNCLLMKKIKEKIG